MIERNNPDTVHAPLGPYSHTATVPAGAELVFLSGQVGVRPDGTTPTTLEAQADQAFRNVVALLDAHGLGPADVAKLTVLVVSGQDAAAVGEARVRHLGPLPPTSTTFYIPALVRPDLFVEVEAVAVRTRGQPASGA